MQITPPTGELLKAVRAHDVALALIYLEQGADPNGADPESGGSFLHVAIERERSGELARLLIEYGADVNAVNPRFGTTPAMYAARSNIPALGLLLEKGVALDRKDIGGRTALQWATQSGNTKAAIMIRKALGQQNAQSEQDRISAIHKAALARQKVLNRTYSKIKIARPS